MFKRYPHQLSGGQKQRVMIAMAMSCEPSLLICDEPTTALDVTVQKNILQLIRELQRQNDMGVIFITHDLSVVAEIADRVAVMYKGEIVEQNTATTIVFRPQHPIQKPCLPAVPVLHQKGERLPVVSDFMEGVWRSGSREVWNTVQSSHTAFPNHRTPDSRLPTPGFSCKNLKVYFPSQKNIAWQSNRVYARC
jgi:peptide/nickel transport system ATP-binding protein